MDFRTGTGQRLMQRIADETDLSKSSLKHVKHFLTGVFTFVKQQDVFGGENPMRDVAIPKPKGSDPDDTYAYSLDEVLAMLKVLPEPAKTIVATAALTGLRRSELRGLRWEDLSGNQLLSNVPFGTRMSRTRRRRVKLPCLLSQLSKNNWHPIARVLPPTVLSSPGVRPAARSTSPI